MSGDRGQDDARSTTSAILNILEDAAGEKAHVEATQKAVLNILEDSAEEKARLADTHRAALNILEDAAGERARVEGTQKAVLNILDDFAEEKARLADTQRAALNILEDFDIEKNKVESVNVELRNEIAERTRAEEALRIANTAVERANKELEAFSYSVSHDLRAPLRHVDGFVNLLTKSVAPQLDEKHRRWLDMVSESAKQMGRLIDDLLVFSRMGRSELKTERVDSERLVGEVVRDLGEQETGRSIEWEIGALPPVPGDPPMLRLVWVNLISNALKYTRPKSPARIEISSRAEGSEVIFCVRDNGVGFDMQYVHRLFGVFQRLHGATEFEGTGIGLANVRRIVSRHGGRTWAESTPGEGAIFYFSLPNGKEGS